MSEMLPAALDPIISLLFGIGAIFVFVELLITIYHGATGRFTGTVILQIAIFSFIFVICLDWISGFNFFKNVLAPFVWNILNGVSTG